MPSGLKPRGTRAGAGLSAAPSAAVSGIERVIPLRFVLLQPGVGSADNVTWANVAGSVQVTNQAFRNAGVQFEIASVERFDSLTSLSATAAQPCEAATVRWDSVAGNLASIFPALTGYPAGSLPPPATERSIGYWLYDAASRFSLKEQLVEYVLACGGGFAAATPWDARAASGDGAGMNDWWKFAHEMGHALGVMHSDGDGYPGGDAAANMVCMPSATFTCNGTTSAGMTTLADFWDMVYLPGGRSYDRGCSACTWLIPPPP